MRNITTHDAPATGLRGIGDTSWHAHAACHGMDPKDADAAFHPLPRDKQAIDKAKALCGLCPVRRDCLNHALENDLKEGVWGGVTAADRRKLHKGLPARLDYGRIAAFLNNNRDVHLTEAEREIVIDHAYARAWRTDRLASALKIGYKHAQELLRQAADRVVKHDQILDGPPNPYKKNEQARQTDPASSQTAAAQPAAKQPVPRPATPGSAAPETASGPTPPADAGPATGVHRPVPARSGPASRPEQPPQKRRRSSPPVKAIDRAAGPGDTRPEGWHQLSFLEAALAHTPVGKAA
ncbi:WhiB-like transcription factor [Streptomyces yokosukanensis]|uniref:Transcriptional regulator WhiB n=1 Tax=Streptomyces yokosukanensis TaxID=67386 RepID=A0A101NZG3_9ACTN|nr:WhiB family transcriptional regulator [Streptomyces yokosukanensis]KUN02107.1 WhiB-like transcription factor [Streptomyces yokosukanensis]